MSFLENIYAKSPVFLQNYFISLYGYQLKNKRYGKLFKKQCIQFKQQESFSKQQFRDYQTKELRKLLVHAFNNVPFYNELYKKHGLTTSDFLKFEIENLHKLPYLKKEDLRTFGTTSLLSKSKENGQFVSTSGSTGTPIKIYYSNNFMQTWFALYETRVRNWAGVNFSMPRGMIGGKRVLPTAKAKPPYYRYNIAEKQTYFSAYHISEKTVKNYLKGIIENKVEYMVGYAMSNYFLADLIVKENLRVPKLKAVLTSSEKLTPKMRETFQKAYGCKTFDAYSGVEACGLISENSNGELLWSDDVAIAEVDENNELTCTGLLNFDQPLIRYRIGDLIKVSENQKTISGVEMLKIDSINGRIEDVIITKDGRKMVRFHSIFTDLPIIKSAQVIQNSYTDFELNIVVVNKEKNIEQELKQRIESQLGKINLKINYLDEIPLTSNGKFQSVISKITNG